MTITAVQVKELRQATGVGMMECKKALQESQGDMQKAIIWLRERGMSRAEKKAGRTAAEGLVTFAISEDAKSAAILEINCETDFAAKNSDFQNFANKLSALALAHKVNTIDELKKLTFDTDSVEESLTELIAKVGENMNLRRIKFVHVDQGVVVGYNHMAGKIGSLVCLEGDDEKAKGMELGSDLAMHIAASSPRYLSNDQVSQDELAQERELAHKKLKEEGKPEAIIEKIMQGQMKKFFSEVCFLDQPFVKEPKMNVQSYIKQSGSKFSVKSFVRFQLGEGIEVVKENFADEVAAQLD